MDHPLRRMRSAVFAGERRVWRVAAICAVPVLALTAFYCLRPRLYETGTDSVEAAAYIPVSPAKPQRLCVPGLQLAARSAFVRLRLTTPDSTRPPLRMTLTAGGRTIVSELAPVAVAPGRPSNADFPIPRTAASPASVPASVCVSAEGIVRWGATPLSTQGATAPTLDGAPQSARIAVWYLPAAGERRSFLAQAGAIFSRAALFRPGAIGAWTYPLLLFVVLPGCALLAVRCLAVALAGGGRRMALWVFAIAALNACCWALVTPAFQGPDEVDHFAYTQSLVERGREPSRDPLSPLPRWSGAENLALEGTSFLTDHQVGDSRVPWLSSQQREYGRRVAAEHPARDDGGGYTTSAAHGPLYYLALSPAYLLTRGGSVFSQLTLMRITSALIGALVALFTFLLARELAPRRPWLAVLAALLVAYEPMYGFMSGIVNNDVGVNAAAAALELLLLRMLRRGMTVPWAALTGAVLVALPNVKGTGLSLYPVAGLVFLGTLWRHHGRRDLVAWLALAAGALLFAGVSSLVLDGLAPAASAGGGGSAAISSNASAVSEALHHIPSYLSYLWQAVLPRLPFMTPYFPHPTHPGFVLFDDPGFVIFVERGWAAFGWYDVYFPHRLYVVICLVMLAFVGLGVWAARRERAWLDRHRLETLALIAMPVAVVAGFTAAYFTTTPRAVIAEFGRYAFPAIGPLAVLCVGALHALGRRRMLSAGVILLVAMIGLSYASQLLTLTSFYA
jgi:hypothetical protein